MSRVLPAASAPETSGARRAFLLSPARCDGRRAKMLLNPKATFPLAVQLRSEGAPIGDVFAFLSGLYFRGKIAYASAFADGASFVITTDRGLVPPDTRVTHEDIVRFAGIDLASGDERFRGPLRRTAERLNTALGGGGNVVLLGSIATGKYADLLLEIFDERLLFPIEFVGRGDMSRGGLLLRSSRAGSELTYVPVRGAIRRGKRPPKLGPP